MPKVKGLGDNPPLYKFLERRRNGYRPYPGERDLFNKKLAHCLLDDPNNGIPQYFEYSSTPFYQTEIYRKGRIVQEERTISATGGIFNLEFSPDGRILSAACERKNILIFDPLTRKVVRNIENAHQDCVNCVRFLDTRTFASCSDDTTVALWDVRNLSTRVRTLRGHSNWVKNIEYSQQDNVLVTSGFDGAIYTWDFNKYSESNSEFSKVFYTNGLMRMRLTPDASRMVISTMNGYLILVHDLDLGTMAQDLAGFKPNMYRLMQMSGKAFEQAVTFTRLFHAKRNRIELIADFPEQNDAEIISSLRLHPQGWVAVSRNTSSDESSEWCCVHDIQPVQTNEDDDEPIKDQRALTWGRSTNVSVPNIEDVEDGPNVQRFRSGRIEIISTGPRTQNENGQAVIRIDLTLGRQNRNQDDEDDEDEEERRGAEGAEEVNVDGTNFISAESMAALDLLGELRQQASAQNRESAANDDRVPQRENAVIPPELPEGELPDPEGDPDPLLNIVGVGPSLPPTGEERTIRNERGGFLLIGNRGSSRVLYFGSPAAHRARQENIPTDAKIHKNIQRLTHHIEESNTGRGFIKEQSFSPCGRFIASPFGFGVRLLGWNSACSDLSDCVPTSPVQLYEIGTKSSHKEVVLSSSFSPNQWLLVTGCLAGRISWHQPTF